MLIAPLIDGIHTYDSDTVPDKITKLLNDIGPKESISGKFELGYTLNLPLFKFYKRRHGIWEIDLIELRKKIEIILNVDNKVVIYLSLNHFTDANVELCRELLLDSKNLMFNSNGPMKEQNYFNVPLIPWTISDYSAPITELRINIFRAALQIISDLYSEIKHKLIGISILGECHDMCDYYLDGPKYGAEFHEASDYSKVSADGFRFWLRENNTSISEFNAKYNLNISNFEEINPPSANFFKGKNISLIQHIDDCSFGTITLFGWCIDELNRNYEIEIYLNGKYIGLAQKELSRTDVADTLNIQNPNVGFRFSIDYRNLAFGEHTVQVVVSSIEGLKLELGSFIFIYNSDGSACDFVNSELIPSFSNMQLDDKYLGHLDYPSKKINVLYNPISLLWVQYRNLVTRNYLQYFAKIALEYSLPKELIFSHQICPSLQGSWNEDLISTKSSLLICEDYNPGITLYGGTAYSNAFKKLREDNRWTKYAVVEMHPLTLKNNHEYLNLFNFHLHQGAVYVAPYFLSIVPDEIVRDEYNLSRFEISPNNFQLHSNVFYSSLVRLLNS